MARPTLVCITPVRNEAWILDRFLKCATLWADHIIIADQHSNDGSMDIAREYSNVILVDNPFGFDERKRQKLLFDAARKIPGQRLLLSLDADEILTPNFPASPEWKDMLDAKPGTLIWFRIANIRPDMRTYWTPDYDTVMGFMDDDREFPESAWRLIHGPRIPTSFGDPSLVMGDVRVMHFQYTDWKRMQSKHRWYQCWERINDTKRSAITIYRMYHHMYAVRPESVERIPEDWLEEYRTQGIELTCTSKDADYYWDREVLGFFDRYGTSYFSKERIWDIDWVQKAKEYGCDNIEKYRDPRSTTEKLIQYWLVRTQRWSRNPTVRLADSVLKGFGW